VARSAIVLAAGFGTRMNSKEHKVLHKVCGKPMILHILDELDKLQLNQIIVVVGQNREAVQAVIGNRAEFAIQTEQLGTGHAVQTAVPYLRADIETTVVLYGDAPLIRAETIENLLSYREQRQAAAVVLTADVKSPTGLGRVFQAEDGLFERIVEEKDATGTEKSVTCINTGIYAFQTTDLVRSVAKLSPNNAQQEYYLTDTLTILRNEQKSVYTMEISDEEEIASVNDRVQLAAVEKILQRRLCESWMRAGVTFVDSTRTYIEVGVQIGRDTVIWPGSYLLGNTRIGEDCVIGPDVRLQDTTVHNQVRITNSVIFQSIIEEHASIGPFAYIRPGSHIGARVKIGDFVEIKNSTIGEDSKVSHLAYVGDAQIGKRVNVACGVVTVNYDGRQKHQTVVGDDSFVGCNVNLVAPLTVGEGAYLCAGSTVTEDVPNDGFVIGRARQITKDNYVKGWIQSRFEK